MEIAVDCFLRSNSVLLLLYLVFVGAVRGISTGSEIISTRCLLLEKACRVSIREAALLTPRPSIKGCIVATGGMSLLEACRETGTQIL